MSRRQFNIKLLFVLTTAIAIVLAVIISWPERSDIPSTWNRDQVLRATLSTSEQRAGVRIVDGDILAWQMVRIDSSPSADSQDELHECIVWTVTQKPNGNKELRLTYLRRDRTHSAWHSPVYEGEYTSLNEAYFDQPPSENELAHFVSWSDWSWVPVPTGKRRNVRVRSPGHGYQEVLFVEGRFIQSAWKRLTGLESELDVPEAYR